MVMRLKLLQMATAALYMGPLLAGLSGYGWAMLTPFLSIFLLWLMILRPHQWPQSNYDWLHARTWVAVLSKVVSQLLLIAVLFGIGRGIGGVMGFVPLFHPALPVAISFIAIPISRLFWNAEKALAEDLSIDELLYPQRRPANEPAGDHPATPVIFVAPLLSLGDDISVSDAGLALEEVLEEGEAWPYLSAIEAALVAVPGKHMPLREALIVWSTDPDRIATSTVPGALLAAFRVAGTDNRLLSRLLPRAGALARSLPHRHALFPDRQTLEALQGAGLSGQAAMDLQALLATLDQAASSVPEPAKRTAGSSTGTPSMA